MQQKTSKSKSGTKPSGKHTNSQGVTFQRTPDGVRIVDSAGTPIADYTDVEFLGLLQNLGAQSPQDSSDISLNDDWGDD